MTDPDVERQLVELAHEFAASEIRPVAAAFDVSEAFPADVVRKAAAIGLTSFDLPAAYGGGGIDSVRTACLVGEELAWGDSPIGSIVGSASFFADPLAALGTEEQRDRWITPLCGDDPPMTGLAITEPGAGSDAAAITTTATKVDGGYLLNGQKTWVSGAPVGRLLPRVRDRRAGHAVEGDHLVRRGTGRRGVHVRRQAAQARRALLPDGGAVLRRLLRARRPADRRGRAGVRRRDALVRPVARDARGQLDRDRTRRPRVRGRLREAARGVRQEDPRVPGGELPARRREDRARPGAADDAARRGPGRRRRALRDRGVDGQARGLRGGVEGGERRRDDARAATATPASTRSRSGCETPSSRRSTKGRATSSD